ncbi:MAG: sugar transferase [Flavobacteriia bacterium]|nr:MAG: sugar transferase [Flavobacteriia bacterium]
MRNEGLNVKQKFIKRSFDIIFSIIGLAFFGIPIILLILLATFSTGKFGLFKQERIGKDTEVFNMYKIRSMKREEGSDISITVAGDKRITRFGKFLRKFKLDELPQLFNVLIGDMSFVGPRPDIKGYADRLQGEDRIILTVNPGITGPATIRFKNEEQILARQQDPKKYNDQVIWPEKVRINIQYIENWTLWKDIKYIFKTIFNSL